LRLSHRVHRDAQQMARRNDQARRRSLQLANRQMGMGRASQRTEILNEPARRIGGQAAQQRRSATDCQQYRQAAGYCGKPQLYQGVVQYTTVKAFCSALAARSNVLSETSTERISSSLSARSII